MNELAANYNRPMSDALLNGFNGVLSQNKYSDEEVIKAGREFMESGKKWPAVAELVDIITTNRQRVFAKERAAKQVTYSGNEPSFTPSVADSALYRYIYLSAFSKTPVSVAGFEEYAMKVFGLDPDNLISGSGRPVQASLYTEPLPHDQHRVGEKWPQIGAALPEKLYRDPWLKDSGLGMSKGFPTGVSNGK